MAFPVHRPRRLRGNQTIRRMVRETIIRPDDFIFPLFIMEGKGHREPIAALPGNFRLTPDMAVLEARRAWEAGVPAVILFGLPNVKDAVGSGAWAAEGVVQQGVKAIKDALPEMMVICDTCLCEYTDHGHCGQLCGHEVDNDKTLELLAKTAVSQAAAGADIVAPSDMMDGRVTAIRDALDEAGMPSTPIMSYAAKYASAFYGPFREAVDSAPAFGDRRTHQMDPANAREAMREVALDIDEGADIVMVKPALPYLDIIRQVADSWDVPVAAYNVSGEFAMVKAAAEMGWIDGRAVMLESLTSIKRAGAEMIITYFAIEAAETLG